MSYMFVIELTKFPFHPKKSRSRIWIFKLKYRQYQNINNNNWNQNQQIDKNGIKEYEKKLKKLKTGSLVCTFKE